MHVNYVGPAATYRYGISQKRSARMVSSRPRKYPYGIPCHLQVAALCTLNMRASFCIVLSTAAIFSLNILRLLSHEVICSYIRLHNAGFEVELNRIRPVASYGAGWARPPQMSYALQE